MTDVVSQGIDSPSRARRRRTTVAGVSGGVGTTTLAAALDGVDRGVFVGRPVDVLVCRGTAESLQRAGQAAQMQTDATGRKPMLAVTATDARGLSRNVSARLRLASAYASRVVALPWVRRWQESTTYLHDARSVHGERLADLPRSLRAYARATTDIRRHLGAPDLSERAYRSRGPWGAPAHTTGRTR